MAAPSNDAGPDAVAAADVALSSALLSGSLIMDTSGVSLYFLSVLDASSAPTPLSGGTAAPVVEELSMLFIVATEGDSVAANLEIASATEAVVVEVVVDGCCQRLWLMKRVR